MDPKMEKTRVGQSFCLETFEKLLTSNGANPKSTAVDHSYVVCKADAAVTFLLGLQNCVLFCLLLK